MPARPLPTFVEPSDLRRASCGWLHEVKHDGFRVIARKDGGRVRLYSRPGNDLTRRFPSIAEALARPARALLRRSSVGRQTF